MPKVAIRLLAIVMLVLFFCPGSLWADTNEDLSALYGQQLKDITAKEPGTVTASPGLTPSPQARMIVSGNYGSREEWEDVSNPTRPDYTPKFLVADRGIMVVQWPSGLAGYEVATGRELWRAPQTATFLLNGVIFGIEVLNDSGEAKVQAVEVLDGRHIWQMSGLCPTWATDHQKENFFLDMDYCGGLFSFDMRGKSDDWIQTYDPARLETDWARKHEAYMPIRQKKLTEYGLQLTTDPQLIEDDQPYSEPGLLLTNKFMGMLDDGGYCGGIPAFQHGSKTISSGDALAVDASGFFRFSVWGPDRNLSNPDQALLLFDRINDRVSELKLGDGRNLTGRDLKAVQDENGNFAFSLAFSPQGACLGMMDQAGDLHFFDNETQGRHIGSIKGQTKVAINSKSVPLKDLKLISILDEDITGQPVCHFSSPDNPRQPVILKLNLAENKGALFFSPEQVATSRPTALNLSSKNVIAAGLDNGDIHLIDLKDGRPQIMELNNASPWVHLAFSGSGEVLVAANKAGKVYSIKSQTMTQIADGLPDIIHLAVDAEGRRAWATTCEDGYSSDSLCSITLIDAEKGTKPIQESLEGSLIAMAFDREHNQAQAVIGQKVQGGCLNSNGPVQFSKVINNQKTQARLLVMSDCLTVPGLDSFGTIWDNPMHTGNLGFSPNHKMLVTEPNCECGVGITQHFYIGLESGKRGAFEDKDFIPSFMGATFFSPDSQLVVLAEQHQGRFFLYNTQTGSMLASMTDTSKHPLGIINGTFLNDVARFLTSGPDGTLRLWDLNGGAPENILTWVFFQDGNWLLSDKDSRFDTPNLDRLEGVHWTVKRLPGKTFPLASLMREYYQPRLAEYVLSGEKLKDVPNIADNNLAQHGVRLVSVKDEPNAPGRVAVTVELYVRGDDAPHPAQDLKLFRDNRLVAQYSGENGGLFDLPPDGKMQWTFRNIALPQNKNEVMFKGYAFNSSQVRSKYFERPYSYKPTTKTESRLRLVAMGVNDFDNASWNLKYAANDALAFAETLPKYLSAAKADVRILASGEGLTKPSKANLKSTLKSLEFSSEVASFTGSGPEDTVVLTISSHGLTEDGTFYIIPADIPGHEKRVTPEMLTHAISAEELGEWLTTLDAGEIILILDTCQSGAALGGREFKPGPMGDKGLGQLAYDKAMRVLCATNEDNAAMELGSLGHGLLSYSLLVDGLENGLAAPKPGQAFSFKDWLDFGKERTAELYANIASGKGLGTTRGKFKVDKSVDNANPPLGQEPYLFDFGGDSEAILKPGRLK